MAFDHENLKKNVFEIVKASGIDKESVNFIYLFGSYTENPESARDIDICVSLDSETEENEYKLKGRAPENMDISVFENLPLQVKNQVFKGELLYTKNKQVYDKAFKTFRDFESFKPLYQQAIET